MGAPDVIPISAAKTAPLRSRTDDELMRLARAGRRDAFAALVERHMTRLTDFCVKMTGDRSGGEDLAQETWLAIWDARERYTPAGRFESYLFTVARNRCKNASRSRFRRGRVLVDEDRSEKKATGDSDSLEAVLAQEEKERVSRALEAISPKLREAILLRFTAELDYAEIARVIRRGESTARSRVYHGLKKLRQEVHDEP